MLRKGKSAAAPPLPPRPDEGDSGVPGDVDPQEPLAAGPDGQRKTQAMGVVHRVNPSKSRSQPEAPAEKPGEIPQNPGALRGMMDKVDPFKSSAQAARKETEEQPATRADAKQNPGTLVSVMQKFNPFKSRQAKPDAASGRDGPTDDGDPPRDPTQDDAERGLRVSPRPGGEPDGGGCEPNGGAGQQPKKRNQTFRIKRMLPAALFGPGAKLRGEQEVEVQTLEMVDKPAALDHASALDPLEDQGGLLAWWQTVEGWSEWNQSIRQHQSQEVAEDAADRVFLAAQLFVRLFNRRGALLQRRVLALLALADAADDFHKRAVSAGVGGGAAGVAGSLTTITGLVLAPFTAGTSLIVTAVGIGVATAGGVASASANIAGTVHSKTGRKKVEKMIRDYQEEMSDIKDCLQFLQEGMETLAAWDFERYAESISQKHLNQNVKHVMKEGGRAGKALVINAESLINTVQVLGVAGGAAKAAQVMSVTTGVMSGLFLALDIFFLAKDSAELRKGAKTEFAAKIREACKELQDGLLELNRIKEELQKTMDGIQVEEEDENDGRTEPSELKKPVEPEE